MKSKILLFVFSLLQLLGSERLQASGPAIGIDTAPDADGRIVSKTIFSGPFGISLIVLRDNALTNGGFSSPLFSFGTFQKQGLLRLINQPLGFSAESEIYGEKTRYRLNTAVLEDPSRHLLLTPLPDVFSLYTRECRNGEWNAGGYFRLPLPKFIQAELIFNTAEIPIPPVEQAWLLGGFQYPGGRLYHLGARVSGTLGRLFIFLAGGLSLSETVLPGGFIISSVGVNLDSFHWAVMCGAQGDDYVSPDGHCPPERFTVGTAIDWKPCDWISFHPALSYGRHKAAWYDTNASSDQIKCSLTTKFQALLGPFISAQFNISAAYTGEEDGTEFTSHFTGSCQTKWQLTPAHLIQFSYRIDGLAENWTHDFSLKQESRFGRVTAAAQVNYDPGRHEIEMSLSGEIKENDYCLTIKASGVTNDVFAALVKPCTLTIALSCSM